MAYRAILRLPLFTLLILVITWSVFLYNTDIKPLHAACVCECSNGRVDNTSFTNGSQCDQYCSAFRQCPPPNGACTMDTAKSTCDDVSTTPGGGGTDSACTKEINGVVFPCDPLEVKTGPKDWIRNAVEIVLQLVGAGAFLLSIYGGGLILFARGDPKKVSEGRKVVVYAAIGLIVILLSYFMLNVIFSVIQEAITS